MSLRSNAGFTLVEVLIAIAILSCGLVLVVEGMGRSVQAIRIAENKVTASRIADEKFREYEMEVRQSHTLRSGSDNGKQRVGSQQFVWVKSAAPFTDELMKDETKMNLVTSEVKWKEGSRSNALVVQSLLLNREKKA